MENIQVYVRMKPQIREDELQPSWIVESNNLISSKNREIFTYDQVFDSNKTNTNLFESTLKENIPHLFKGINLSVFVYGQTSTGKTFTMRGDEKNPGLIPASVREVFESLVQENKSNSKSEIKVSYMELYNESLNDLLDAKKKNLDIRESQQKGIFVEGLTEIVVDSAEKALNLLKQGDLIKIIAETKLNEGSSRSHTIFRISIETTEIIDGRKTIYYSQFNLVDLAGSENVAKAKTDGIRMKEGTNINKSLLALSMVIHKLSSSQKQFVNFRDSKLTRLLQSSLSGNSRTTIICTVTQSSLSYQETVNTLNFGSKAKNIKTTIKINEIKDEKAKILQENHLLKSKIKELEDMFNEKDIKKNSTEFTMIVDDSNMISESNQKNQNEMLNTLEKEVSFLKKIIYSKQNEKENQQSVKDDNNIQNFKYLSANKLSSKKTRNMENTNENLKSVKRGNIEQNIISDFNAYSDFNYANYSRNIFANSSVFGENFENEFERQNSNNYYIQQLLIENEELKKGFYEMRNNFVESIKSKDNMIKSLNCNQKSILEKCEKFISDNEENYLLLKNKYEKLQQDILEKEEDNKRLSEIIKERGFEIQNFKNNIVEMKTDIAKMNLIKVDPPLNNDISSSIEITKQFDKLNKFLKQEQEQNKELLKINEILADEKKKFKMEKDNLYAELCNLKSKVDSIERNNENLINESCKNKQDVNSYKNESKLLNDKLNAQKSEFALTRQQINKLQSELNKAVEENKISEALNNSLLTKLEKANLLISKYENGDLSQQKFNELEKKFNDQKSVMSSIQHEFIECKKTLQIKEENEIRNYEKIIKESFDKISELQKEICNLQEKNKNLEIILKITPENPQGKNFNNEIKIKSQDFTKKKRKKLNKAYNDIIDNALVRSSGKRMKSLARKEIF